MSAPTLSRAPLLMRYNRESYFEPRFVSIGPLYYEKLMEQRVMEKAKDKCILYFTRELQTSTSDSLDYLVRQIKVDEMMKDRIHRWYGKNFVCPEKFFRMLVRDSCFIIRIILAFSREGEESMFYPGVDIKTVRFDLLLMENQIPFFFLRKVYYFLRDENMLPPIQSSENYPSNSPENDSIQSSPQGNTCMSCLPIRKQRHISQSTAGRQTHSHEPQPTLSPEQSQNNGSQFTLSPGQSHIHEPQSTLSPEQSQNNGSQFTLSPRQSKIHDPQPTLSPEQSQNNGSQFTLSPGQSKIHDPQPTLSPEQSQNNRPQFTLSPEQNQSHGPQPTLSPEQSQNNRPQFTLSPEQNQSHGPQPTLFREQSHNNGPQFTFSQEQNQSHGSQPTLSLGLLSPGQSQVHQPQPILSPEQSQNNGPQFTLCPGRSQSHGPQPTLSPEEISQNHGPQSTFSLEQNKSQSRLSQSTHRPQLSAVSLEQSQSSPEITMLLDEFLIELKPFIWFDMPWNFYEHEQFTEPKHLLDLYWKWCMPSPLNGPGTNESNQLHDDGVHASWVKMHLRSNAPKRIKNAYELYRRVGVTFQKREHQDNFGVTFRNGILQIPHLQLDLNQTTLLSNLIAFEEFKHPKYRLLTSYVLLLDGLINTEKDVELLQRHGVITNKLSSSQTASTYLNDIGNVCTVDYNDHYCRKQFDDLNSYYHSKWNSRFAKLRHRYFNSPWAVISFSAGATLLIFSGLQTVYNIVRFYKHR